MPLNICIMISITINIVVGSCNAIYAITVNASKTRGYIYLNTIPRSVPLYKYQQDDVEARCIIAVARVSSSLSTNERLTRA